MKKLMINQALDLETYVKVRNLAPRARFDCFTIAPDIVDALEALSKKLDSRTDPKGAKYWKCGVRDVREQVQANLVGDFSTQLIGRGLNALGIVTWNSNFANTAWTQSQLDELKKVFTEDEKP
jgi:hypothetical protein